MAKCIGCGIRLQNTDKTKLGYTPVSVIEENTDLYCERCYQVIHYNKHYDPMISKDSYYEKIDFIKNEKAIILLMIDIMDIEAGFIPNLSKSIGGNPVVILLNKTDILPKSVHLKNLENYIRDKAREQKLNFTKVLFISSKQKKNIEGVINEIKRLKTPKEFSYKNRNALEKKDCYLLGCASVGKSTFLNTLKELYLDYHGSKITTSEQFQTTQDFIKIPLDKKSFIIDTPGLINEQSFNAALSAEAVKKIMPKSFLKVRTYQLRENQTIFIGGLVRLDFLNVEKCSVSFFVSNDLYLHRTKFERADEVYDRNKFTQLNPPFSEEENEAISDVTTYEYELKPVTYDFLISGLGFVHITAESGTFKATLSKKIAVKFTETIL